MQPEQRIQLYIGSVSLLAVMIALVSQHVYDMQPCAWCVTQRMLYIVIAVIGFWGSRGQATRTKLTVWYALMVSVALAGVTAAVYQALWRLRPNRSKYSGVMSPVIYSPVKQELSNLVSAGFKSVTDFCMDAMS